MRKFAIQFTKIFISVRFFLTLSLTGFGGPPPNRFGGPPPNFGFTPPPRPGFGPGFRPPGGPPPMRGPRPHMSGPPPDWSPPNRADDPDR